MALQIFQLKDNFGLADALISAQDEEFKTKYLLNYEETDDLDYMLIEPTFNQLTEPKKRPRKNNQSIIEFNLSKDVWKSITYNKEPIPMRAMTKDQLNERELCNDYMNNYLKLNNMKTKESDFSKYKFGYIVNRKCKKCNEKFTMKFNLINNKASLEKKEKCNHQSETKIYEI